MTINELYVLIAGLILPALYQRVHFRFRPQAFHITPLRTWTKLNIHHGHWGLLWVFVALGMMLCHHRNWGSIIAASFGTGLILDEIVAMFMMKGPGRQEELNVYRDSLKGTIGLIALIVLLSSGLFLVRSSKTSSHHINSAATHK